MIVAGKRTMSLHEVKTFEIRD